jgi:DNA mismatch endonuclease, patch repair protein
MDTISKSARSSNMSRIRDKNTQPELAVRSVLHRMGYRFRLHSPALPGRPDIVLPRHRKIVLVQGCFWHGHNCSIACAPKSRQHYWYPKLERTKVRDKSNILKLRNAGWQVLELWECDIRKERFIDQLVRFMKTPNPQSPEPT